MDINLPFSGDPNAFLYAYWGKYCALDDTNMEWLRAHAYPLPKIQAGDMLFKPGDLRNYVYFVVEGLLAAAVWDETGRRHLLRLAPAKFSLMTTQSLYTNKQVNFNIVALRDSVLLRIPVTSLRDYKEQRMEASVLIHVLREKKLKQLTMYSYLMSIKNEVERYRFFETHCKELHKITTQQEQADYLNISLMSIYRGRGGKSR